MEARMNGLTDDHLYRGMEKPLSEADQRASDEANDALDAIDGALCHVIEYLDKITKLPAVEVSYEDWVYACGCIRDALADLFGPERERLMSVGGWRPKPEEKLPKSH